MKHENWTPAVPAQSSFCYQAIASAKERLLKRRFASTAKGKLHFDQCSETAFLVSRRRCCVNVAGRGFSLLGFGNFQSGAGDNELK
jgi:hypothetical protein